MRKRPVCALAAHVAMPARPLLALALAALWAPTAVCGAPTGATVVAGQVQVTQPDARTMLVTQGSDKAIINWRSFSIAAGETVRFQQPGSGSVALNRVTTATPSEIFGRLSANGKVFLVNSSGVMFGRGAAVDVGALVASTLDIRDADFMGGRYAFSDTGGNAGAVRNEASINAAERGTIALLGAQVSNSGTLTARLGTVGLAAGAKVSLDFNGDGLTRIVVDAARLNALVENNGAVIADGGLVTMTARALGALTEGVVRQDGLVRANTLVERNGSVFLDGGGAGQVVVEGSLEASGLAPGRRGGEVIVLGRDIVLGATAAIDARGDAGGGVVLVGGDYQGGGSVARAASTTMAAGASISADALGSGNGGKIVLWSDGPTSVHGGLSAAGGARGGDGGTIETSGRKLDVAGIKVGASSPAGKGGAWLLDPDDINIDGQLALSIGDSLSNGTDVTVSTRNGTPSEAAGNITVLANIDKTGGGPATLLLDANNSIVVEDNLHIASTAAGGKLHVVLQSDTGAVVIQDGSSVLTNGGDFRILGQKSPVSQNGDPSFGGDGVQLNGATVDTRVAQSNGGGSGASGTIAITGKGNLFDGGRGVSMVDTSLLSTTGAITISGAGGYDGGGFSADGVDISLAGGARLASGSGGVTISGTAVATGLFSSTTSGVRLALEEGSSLSAPGGAVAIQGSGGSGGVSISLNAASISADATSIAGSGTSGGAGVRAFLSNDAAIASTSGALTIAGTGGGNDTGVDIGLFDSRIAARGGNLQLSGTGGDSRASGVAVSSSDDGGVDGSSGSGGVMTASTARILADHGNLTIAGINGSGSANSEAPAGVAGVMLTGVELGTVQGDIRIAGAGVASGNNYSTGVALTNVLASTASGAENLAPGGIRILGLSSGSAPGLLFGGVTLGGASMAGDIILGARNDGQGPMIDYGGTPAWRNTVRTSSVINLRPDDQNYNFGGVPASAVPISVGNGVNTSSSGFNVSLAGLGIGSAGVSNAVIGSKEQTGAIVFNDPAPFLGNLTLQNGGAGSQGIVLASNVNAGRLTLSTGGSVNASEIAINADSLLLHGTQPESSFQLTNGGNRVAALGISFDTPKSQSSPAYGDVNFTNNGGLLIAGMAGTGFSTATNAAQPIDAAATIVAGDLVVRASGPLGLRSNVSTLGSDITLVTGTVFDSGGHTLTPAAGGKWLVFADTWLGENRGPLVPDSPHPNYYNCAYGAPCAAGIKGNRFVYRAQPTATLTADDLARAYGDPNPPLSFKQAGLVNGDTVLDALSGGYTTSATQASPLGVYAVTGSFTSPVGYAVANLPGSLTINRAGLLVAVDDKSKVYGDADPLLTARITGLKFGETAAVVSGLILAAPTGAQATAGSHAIVGADAVAANYTIAYQPGTLTVAKAPLLVLAFD
ncbi:MAG: hemagglutinin, partial [Massilia sp.]|nr:hemagglutinin [Massilia sp.]